jgi:hypothetical protein
VVQRVVIAVVATIGLKPDGPSADQLRERVRAALKQQPDLTLLDVAIEKRSFASVETERPSADLQGAQKALRKAQKALRNFELDEAQSGYAKATEILQPVLGLEEAIDLDKERLALGAALAYALRNDAEIAERILEYAIRYGAEGPPTWPPELSGRLKQATPASDTKLSVRTDPPGAEIFVDGARIGVAPAVLDLRPGLHRIEAKKGGRFSADQWVTTSALGKEEVALTLPSDISSALRRQPAANGLGPELASQVFALAKELGATMVVIAGLNQGRVSLRTIDESGESQQRFEGDDSDEGIALAVSQMFHEPEVPGMGGVSPWAWVGAGAGAAAIAGGVALRVLAVNAQQELMAREGALTQRDAFDRDSDVNLRATSGAVLLGVGTAAITGIAVWVIWDLIASDSP